MVRITCLLSTRSVLRDLMSEAEHVVSSVHQFQELLEHEFNNVAAGGTVVGSPTLVSLLSIPSPSSSSSSPSIARP